MYRALTGRSKAGSVVATTKQLRDRYWATTLFRGRMDLDLCDKQRMKKPLLKAFAIVWLTAALTPLTACATTLSSEPIQGQVLDEGTNNPISGAIVVARWQGHLASWGHGKTVCYHVLSTTSDENGHYRLPAWKKNITEDWQKNIRPENVLIDAYKPGYALPTAPSQKREDVLLKPFTGGRGERLAYLERIEYATRCPSAKESEPNLLPFYRVMHEEAKSLVITKDDQKVADGFLSNIEMIELGYDAAMKRAIERAERRKQQPWR